MCNGVFELLLLTFIKWLVTIADSVLFYAIWDQCVCVFNLAHCSESRVTGSIEVLNEELDTVGDHTGKT